MYSECLIISHHPLPSVLTCQSPSAIATWIPMQENLKYRFWTQRNWYRGCMHGLRPNTGVSTHQRNSERGWSRATWNVGISGVSLLYSALHISQQMNGSMKASMNRISQVLTRCLLWTHSPSLKCSTTDWRIKASRWAYITHLLCSMPHTDIVSSGTFFVYTAMKTQLIYKVFSLF